MNKNEHVYILILCTYSLVLGLSEHIYISMFLPLFLVAYKNKKALFAILKKLILLNLFISVIAISVYFSDERLALLIYLRSNMVVLLALMLFCHSNYFDIAYALQRLHIPSKIVTVFYFNGKFIYILLKDLKDFKKNLRLRAFKPKANLLTYKTYANFVGLIFIKAFYRAHNLNNILKLRGFKGEIYSLKTPSKLGFYDISLALLTLLSISIKKGILL